MKRDFEKLVDRMIENARSGVVIEQKILEWKVAESSPYAAAASSEESPARKVS